MKTIIAATILSFAFLLGGLASAQAATLTVTKTADTNDNVCDADCSLREAIFAAAASGDVIEFASPLFDSAQIIVLTSSLINSKTLNISGRDPNLTGISGNNQYRTLYNSGNMTLNDLTIRDGLRITEVGAGIYNAGTLTLNRTFVTDNKVVGEIGFNGKFGGGIFNQSGGTLTINESFIAGNYTASNASYSCYGGGIYNEGNATIKHSTIYNNRLVGEFNNGAGVFNASGGTLLIESSTLTGNYLNRQNGQNRGAALYSEGITRLTNTTISGNTVASNTLASFAGGVFVQTGTTIITNSTIAGNYSLQIGSGIKENGGSLSLVNTIVSANTFNNNVPGGDISGSYNNIGGNFIGGNARLMAIAGNGGITPTHAPAPDSPIINAGNNCVLTENACGTGNSALTTDQRGAAYPRLLGPTVDIGAVEYPRMVSNANISGTGSLRDTLTLASVGDTISFDPAFFSTPRTIPVSAEMLIDKHVNIVGPGANLLTIDAGNTSRIFNVQLNNTLTVTDLTMVNGRAAGGNGGCVSTSGVFNFVNGVIADCLANSGGAVYIDPTGTANLVSSTVRDNGATSQGGAFFSDGQLILTNSLVFGNSASNAGGAIFLQPSRSANVTNSTLATNTAMAGGGIYNLGTTTFTSSTVNGNTSQTGGGVYNDGTAILYGSTISSNHTTSNKGAGIYNAAGRITHLLNTTITNNRADSFAGAGIWNENFTGNSFISLRARNSIIAANISGNGSPVDYVGDIVDLGNNLINNPNPGLAPLGNYGGPTPTHALLPGSPAINIGDNCVLTANTCGIAHSALSNDQRGTSSPRRIGTLVDIGAFERNITIDQMTLPNGVQSGVYSQTLTVTRATSFAENSLTTEKFISSSADFLFAPFTFSIVTVPGQALPPGLTLASNGSLSGTPTQAGTYTFTVKATDTDAMAGAAQYTMQVFAPTAATVYISGRVLTPTGRGLSKARVTLLDSNGNSRTVLTGSFGYYRLDDVSVGETYIVGVVSKRFTFTTQVISVTDDIAGLNFTANE